MSEWVGGSGWSGVDSTDLVVFLHDLSDEMMSGRGGGRRGGDEQLVDLFDHFDAIEHALEHFRAQRLAREPHGRRGQRGLLGQQVEHVAAILGTLRTVRQDAHRTLSC